MHIYVYIYLNYFLFSLTVSSCLHLLVPLGPMTVGGASGQRGIAASFHPSQPACDWLCHVEFNPSAGPLPRPCRKGTFLVVCFSTLFTRPTNADQMCSCSVPFIWIRLFRILLCEMLTVVESMCDRKFIISWPRYCLLLMIYFGKACFYFYVTF